MRPGGSGIRRISESAVMLLPQPDSPTIDNVSPRGHGEVDTVDRFDDALPRIEPGAEVGDFERVELTSRALCPFTRIEDVAQRIAQEIRAEDGEAEGEAGEDHEPRRGADILRGRLRKHAAPGRMRLGNAETEEGERGFGQDGRAELRRWRARSAAPKYWAARAGRRCGSRPCRRRGPPRRRAARGARACSSARRAPPLGTSGMAIAMMVLLQRRSERSRHDDAP